MKDVYFNKARDTRIPYIAVLLWTEFTCLKAAKQPKGDILPLTTKLSVSTIELLSGFEHEAYGLTIRYP